MSLPHDLGARYVPVPTCPTDTYTSADNTPAAYQQMVEMTPMSKIEARLFHLGDVLTVTTGLLVSPRHAVYDLLGFMTGDTLWTHQLPRAAEECKPELLRQHPDLAAVEVPDEFDSTAHVETWLAEQVERFGEQREVRPLPSGDHTRINPLVEWAMHHPDVPVITMTLPDVTS